MHAAAGVAAGSTVEPASGGFFLHSGHRPRPRWPTYAVAAGLLIVTLAAGHAASNMTVRKDDTFQTSVPNALLLDPDSNSVLFEKGGDE